MKRIICYFKGHKRGRTTVKTDGRMGVIFLWRIKCKRCGYKLEYKSPWTRLVGFEMKFGFNGE